MGYMLLCPVCRGGGLSSPTWRPSRLPGSPPSRPIPKGLLRARGIETPCRRRGCPERQGSCGRDQDLPGDHGGDHLFQPTEARRARAADSSSCSLCRCAGLRSPHSHPAGPRAGADKVKRAPRVRQKPAPDQTRDVAYGRARLSARLAAPWRAHAAARARGHPRREPTSLALRSRPRPRARSLHSPVDLRSPLRPRAKLSAPRRPIPFSASPSRRRPCDPSSRQAGGRCSPRARPGQGARVRV